MKTLVLGIGNSLLSDEGVGIHVIHVLQDLSSPRADSEYAGVNAGYPGDGVEYLDGGTLSFTLAGPIEEADALIVVDAAQLDAEPGALKVFRGEAMDRFLSSNRKATVHEVGLTDLMAIAKLTGRWPARRALVAIQPEKLDWGEVPSTKVAAAVPEACRHIQALLGEWRREP